MGRGMSCLIDPSIHTKMKTTPNILTVILLSLCLCLGFLLKSKHTGETRVSQKHDETSYTFSASFPEGLMPKVEMYLDSGTAALRKKHIEFRIQTSAGELEITADKSLNSPAGIKQIENMCRGIAAVIVHN